MCLWGSNGSIVFLDHTVSPVSLSSDFLHLLYFLFSNHNISSVEPTTQLSGHIDTIMHRSAKFQTPPNAVDLL